MEDFVTYTDDLGEYRLWMNKYKVYKNGDIYSPEGKKLKPTISSHGYCTLTPYIDGKRYNKKVHRMVAEVWLPNPDKHPMINHINGIKTDNRVENIEWCSASHNVRHAFDMGLNRSTTAREVVFCETGQVFPSAQKCVDAMGWKNLASAITAACRRGEHSKTKRRKIKGYTVRYYQPTPLVDRLIKAGFPRYPEDYNEDTYYCYLCLAQKWLREVKQIYLFVDRAGGPSGMGYYWYITDSEGNSRKVSFSPFDSFEEALSAGIDKTIELLKEQNNGK